MFATDGSWRIPEAGIRFASRATIRAGIADLQSRWQFFLQHTHAGVLALDGDSASGRVWVEEIGQLRDGQSQRNFGVYHDHYRRTPDGWKFADRVYEVRYLDTTPLPGTAGTGTG